MRVNLGLEEVRCISFTESGQRIDHWAAPGWWTIDEHKKITPCYRKVMGESSMAIRLKRGKEVIYVRLHALDNIRKEGS